MRFIFIKEVANNREVITAVSAVAILDEIKMRDHGNYYL